MGRPLRALAALIVLAAVLVGAVLLVRAANGDYSGDYRLTGYFPSSGEGLASGSEVVFRGVQVGRVSTIALSGHRAKVTVLVDPGFHVPADATATIEPINLFGAEQVSLTAPDGNADQGPYLSAGGTFRHAVSSDEIGDLFAAAAPLLDKINTVNLSAVLADLSQASDGEGPRIARSIEAGAKLAGLIDQTLPAQLQALDSFSQFSAAIAADGSSLNGIADQSNIALPAFDADAAAYQKLLDNLTSFSNEVATIVSDYRPDIDTLLAAGANPARVLTAQQQQIGQVIDGAYQYAYLVGNGVSAYTLPDGSHFAYFNTFILFSDVNTLICNLIAPAQPGLSFLEPLQQALAGSGTPFDCQSELAAFDAAQGTGSSPSPSVTAPSPSASTSTSTPSSSSTSSSSAAQSLTNQAYGILGQPSTSAPQSIGGYVSSLLGGGT